MARDNRSHTTRFTADAAVGVARDSVRMFDELIGSGRASYLNESRRIQALQRLGEAHLKAGRLADARHSADAALFGQRAIVAKNPGNSEERIKLVPILLLAGNVNAAYGNEEPAEKLLWEGRDEAQRIAKAGELTDVIPLSQAEQALGGFYAHHRRPDDARACYQSLAGLWQRYPQANEYVDRQKTLAASLLASVR